MGLPFPFCERDLQAVERADHRESGEHVEVHSTWWLTQRLKLNEIQLGVLVFMIHVITRLPNEVGLMKVFNRIDYREDGEIDEGEVRTALTSFLEMPPKKAEHLAKELMERVDLDSSGFINFTGTACLTQSSWWLLATCARCSPLPTSSRRSTSSTLTTAAVFLSPS